MGHNVAQQDPFQARRGHDARRTSKKHIQTNLGSKRNVINVRQTAFDCICSSKVVQRCPDEMGIKKGGVVPLFPLAISIRRHVDDHKLSRRGSIHKTLDKTALLSGSPSNESPSLQSTKGMQERTIFTTFIEKPMSTRNVAFTASSRAWNDQMASGSVLFRPVYAATPRRCDMKSGSIGTGGWHSTTFTMSQDASPIGDGATEFPARVS